MPFRLVTLSIALLFLILSGSCSSKKDEKLLSNLNVFITDRMRDIDSTAHLDSVTYIRIDTVYIRHVISHKINILSLRNDSAKAEFDLADSKLKSNVKLAKLASGLSRTLFENYRQEAIDNNEKMKEIVRLMQKFKYQIDSLTEFAKKCDTITPVHYQAVCPIQYTRKDKSVVKDTFYVNLNLQKQIVRREDIPEYH